MTPFLVTAIGIATTGATSLAQSTELASPPSPDSSSASLNRDSAVAFLKECLVKVVAEDPSLWAQIADGGLFPEGYWPFVFQHLGEEGADLWAMGFQSLQGWLSPEHIDAVPTDVQLVAELHTVELRDLRPFPLKDFLDESKRPDPMPTVEVNTLTLAIDFNADGKVDRSETTQIHELQGVLYWAPFGW